MWAEMIHGVQRLSLSIFLRPDRIMNSPSIFKERTGVGYTEALASQEEFVEQYTANFQAAAEAGVDSELLTQLSDGSSEAAAQLANLANASKEEIDALNAQFASLKASKEAFATTVAEISTDFTDGMQELENELAETIAAMNMSSEAGAAARSTINSYISAASALEGKVYQAYKKIANRAANALKEGTASITGHAEGTDNAAPGIAVVGEEGPELVVLHGGEKIFNAQETADILNARTIDAKPINAVASTATEKANTYTIDFSPVYNISGGANAEEVRAALEEQSENLRDQVESVINDLITDQNRRQYA